MVLGEQSAFIKLEERNGGERQRRKKERKRERTRERERERERRQESRQNCSRGLKMLSD